MKDTLFFSVPGSNSIHELQPGLALISFAEFDLAYFREQCVNAYAKNGPDSFLDKAQNLKEYLHRCHPWCKALLPTVFDKIALDCVIVEICSEEGIGLEELWARNMNAEDRFGKTLFRRITDYKTGRAINQWLNLQRMQAYAVSKMTVIYGGGAADIQTHKSRKLYYDLAFSQTAAVMGFSSDDMPTAGVVSVPFLRQAATIMPTAVGIVGPAVRILTDGVTPRTPLRGDASVQDQMAGLVINVMTGLEPPRNEDVAMLTRKYGTIPDLVYQPTGFKAILDLEFDQLVENSLYIKIDGESRVCRRYGSATEMPPSKKEEEPQETKTAPTEHTVPTEHKAPAEPKAPAEQAASAEKPAPATVATPATETSPAEKTAPKEKTTRRGPKKAEEATGPAEAPAQAEKKPAARGDAKPDKELIANGKIRTIVELAEDPKRKPSAERTLQEVNTRCNLIWTSMNVRSGWSISAEDASEWFRYLTRLRYGIGTGELKPVALDKFLDATLEVYELLPENV